jgi:hypothetical protein
MKSTGVSENQRERLIRGGIVSQEVDTPKARGGRQKLNPDALAAFARIALKHHAALLLFLRFGMRQNQQFPIINFILEEQQSAVRVHHERFASLFKFAPIMGASMSFEAHFVEDAPAAPGRSFGGYVHSPWWNAS